MYKWLWEFAVCGGYNDFKEHIGKCLRCSGKTINRNLDFEDSARKCSQ